jgi:hypothetical protein
MVRNKSLALLGRETLRIIERYRADKAFLGSTGFTAEMGHSTPDPDDAQVKEAFIRIADETYVLVDSSKYGHNCLTSFVQLRDVRLTITDNRLPRAKAKTLQAAGAKLRIAEVADEARLNRAPSGALNLSTAIETPSGNNQEGKTEAKARSKTLSRQPINSWNTSRTVNMTTSGQSIRGPSRASRYQRY